MMAWTISPISLVVFASGVVALIVGIFAFRKRPDPMALPMAALLFGIAAWALPDAISMLNTERAWVMFWVKATQPASNLAPVAYFVVALKYAGYEKWCRIRVYAVLAGIPIAATLLTWGYPDITIYWQGDELRTVAGAVLLDTQNGPMNWVLLGYAYLVTIGALFLFGSVAIRSGRIHRKQSLLMFAGGLVPLAMNIAFNAGLSPVEAIDFTTTALTVSGVTFAAVLFRYEALDLSPAAYQNVSDLFGDGVLVFDDEYRLIDANEYAETILGSELEVKQPASDVFDAPLEELDRTVFEPATDDNQFYNLRHAPLRNYQDVVVGHAVVLREITELKAHEQRLNVTNRILRHNLRNELNIIYGQIEVLEEETTAGARIDHLRSAAERLMDTAEQARHIQTSMEFDSDSYLPVALDEVAESTVRQYREKYPDATITLDVSASVRVLAPGTNELQIVLSHLIENGIEHNDRDQPQVDVTVTRENSDEIRLTVTDDGPGIPKNERAVLEEGKETQLEHGSGLGLWLVYWFVTAMDGTISFEENDPRGTIVSVRLPHAETDDLEKSDPTITTRRGGSSGT